MRDRCSAIRRQRRATSRTSSGTSASSSQAWPPGASRARPRPAPRTRARRDGPRRASMARVRCRTSMSRVQRTIARPGSRRRLDRHEPHGRPQPRLGDGLGVVGGACAAAPRPRSRLTVVLPLRERLDPGSGPGRAVDRRDQPHRAAHPLELARPPARRRARHPPPMATRQGDWDAMKARTRPRLSSAPNAAVPSAVTPCRRRTFLASSMATSDAACMVGLRRCRLRRSWQSAAVRKSVPTPSYMRWERPSACLSRPLLRPLPCDGHAATSRRRRPPPAQGRPCREHARRRAPTRLPWTSGCADAPGATTARSARGGRARHLAPLRIRQTIPSTTRRSSRNGRPVPDRAPFRAAFGVAHSSSESSDMAAVSRNPTVGSVTGAKAPRRGARRAA